MARYLFLPATLATLVVNLIPLYGVLYWSWDTFQILMLYWIETVVIAFWTIRRLKRLQAQQDRDRRGKPNPGDFNLAGFFTLHAGMFIGVHFIFLWAFFSYDWLKKVQGVGSFFFELLIANGVWAVVVLMFMVHWVAFLTDPKPGYVEQIERRVARRLVPMRERETGDPVMPIIGGLYARIVIMQVAILLGAWISGFSNSLGPLAIVIVLKTLVDLGLGAYTPLKALMASDESAPRES